MNDTVVLPQSNPHHAALEKHMDKTMNDIQKHKEKKAVLESNAVVAHKALMDVKHSKANHSYMGYGTRTFRGHPIRGGKKRRRRRTRHHHKTHKRKHTRHRRSHHRRHRRTHKHTRHRRSHHRRHRRTHKHTRHRR